MKKDTRPLELWLILIILLLKLAVTILARS
jgi:hypothetical protein